MLRSSIFAVLTFACGALFGCEPAGAPPGAAVKAIAPSICNVPPDTSTTPPTCPKGCVFDSGKCEPDRGPIVHD